MLILLGYMARQTNHRAGSDLHPFIATLMYDQPLTSDKTGNAYRCPVESLICNRKDKRCTVERGTACMNFSCQSTIHTSGIL